MDWRSTDESPRWTDGPGPIKLKKADGTIVSAYMDYDTIADELVIELRDVSDGSGPYSFYDFEFWRTLK